MIRWLPLFAAVSLASACAKQENSELQWVRAALERNPDIEIIAADDEAGVFTLRDRATGTISAVPLQEIAAAPVGQLLRKPLPLERAAAAPTPEPAPVTASADEPPAPAPEPATQDMPAQTTEPSTAVNASAQNEKPYTIDRSGGQLKISGPGISVVSAGQPNSASPEIRGPLAAEPIICEGRRMLHLDNRNIYVDGDAITVRGGCELYITNSQIVASGTGVLVQDGTVHIANSHIEGAASSFEAGSEAKVFVQGSTFEGLSRRDQLATVQDQGGNQWR